MKVAKIRQVEFDDIQLVRFWRNLDHVRLRMVFTEVIDRDSQRSWFNSKNLDCERYFIYSLSEKDIGVVSIIKINWREKTFEGGIFCGDLDFLGHWVNIWACLQIYNLAFHDLGLETSFATILSDNTAAINLNSAIGYQFVEQQNKNIGRYRLTKDAFVSKSERLNRYLSRFVEE